MGIRAPDRTKVFLFIADKKIVGLLLAEQISQGYQIIPPTEGKFLNCIIYIGPNYTCISNGYYPSNIVMNIISLCRRHEATGLLLLRNSSTRLSWHFQDLGACRLQVMVVSTISTVLDLPTANVWYNWSPCFSFLGKVYSGCKCEETYASIYQ